MVNLILCMTLLNIGISSQSPMIYNIKVDQIEQIINNDLSGDTMGEYVVMPCRLKGGGIPIDEVTACNNANLNTIMRHYKLRREIDLINKKEK